MSRRATLKLAANYNTCISHYRWHACDEDIARTTDRHVASLALLAHMHGQMRVERPLSASNLLPKVIASVKVFSCAILSIQVGVRNVLRRLDVYRFQHLRQIYVRPTSSDCVRLRIGFHFKVTSGMLPSTYAVSGMRK